MEYRRLGRTDLMVSTMGLGTEYLIDRPQDEVNAVIHAAIAAGVNYFDVFWAKPEFRDSMGAAFAGYREKVFLAAHLGSTHLNGQYETRREPELARRFFEDFLTRYHTDYADILFLHNCDSQEDLDKIMAPGGLKDLALEYKAEGKARYIGFSGHSVDTARQAVESGAVDVLMFTINPAGNAVPGKSELLKLCAAMDIGVIAMKIFGGGKLLTPWQSAELNKWQLGGADTLIEGYRQITPVQGMHYALSQTGVSALVPGCKNPDELKADLAYFTAAPAEKDYSGVLEQINQYTRGECVYCNHCLPCPAGINIGETLRVYETAAANPGPGFTAQYGALPNPASACIECGDCETRCAFGVSVIEKMAAAAAFFGG